MTLTVTPSFLDVVVDVFLTIFLMLCLRRPPTKNNTTVLPHFALNAYTITDINESLCLIGT